MRVRMKQMMVGPAVRRVRGAEYDMNDAEAVRLINAGLAERVTPPGAEAKKAAPVEYRSKGRK